MQTIKLQKLSGSLGARVIDLSLLNLTDACFDQIANALWENLVLVFKNQKLPIEAHLRLGQKFGELHTHPASKGVEGHPEILWLMNSGKSKNITEVWHTDVSCDEKPPSISILQSIQIPEFGGDTQFANQYKAFETLSPAMQKMITPLKAVHSSFGLESIHPVVRTHPETGRKALYVNNGFTKRFDGMTVEESQPLLDYLVIHASTPDMTMRHNWSTGDIVMWDNRCVMHYAVHDYGDAPREMHRVTVAGERPR